MIITEKNEHPLSAELKENDRLLCENNEINIILSIFYL